MNIKKLWAWSCLLLVSCTQYVNAEPKPDDAVHYRQGVLMAFGWNVGPMGAMVKGKVPYDAERFHFLAKRLELLSPMAIEGFIESSRAAKSNAREELWQNFDDFTERFANLEKASADLAEITISGDRDAVVKQFITTVNICKGCHDEYRVKR
jgi:cytochrome c556